MSQQLGIILLVDVAAALAANTLEGNTYLFDNMKLQGSEGLGTGKLISAINGTSFCDGSQANEQVLNWLPYGVGSLPPTLPKSFLSEKSKNSDLKVIDEVQALIEQVNASTKISQVIDLLKGISGSAGVKTQVKSKYGGSQQELGSVGQKIMDVTGNLVTEVDGEIPEINSLNPIITNITGEAVDKNIIYPAAYGSPDMVTDGWYWAASVDTSRPGTYAYTMHIQLYKLSREDGAWAWVPVDFTHEAYIKISNDPKVNGFTKAGMGYLPIPM
ncbi:hypothetical protein NWP17_05020 [Chrysosporum bergii ANA360D]|uniref:Uncharacterized protein n=1 Tax=Chrysosporum bergii ANA360D TaxID=617107 RepID=A0AA43KBG8_9CYAN|nr:hypothetical protein [Chrysosporum bergii]MDH6059803.1 hypothetical protein [Chrysosporum bergii ANA360D]